MNLEYLQSFYITVKCNSISKAAKRLHLTQPGLSIQLQNLENELGVSLLTRSNRGVKLTDEGKIIFDYAHTLLSIQGNMERDLKNIQEESPQLMIGSCKSIGEYALPCSIYTFKKLHSEVDINIELDNSTKIIEKLCDHTINIGIIQYNPEINTLDTKIITTDELLLVGNCDNTPEKISIDELKEIPLILRENNSGTRIIIEKALGDKDIYLEDLNIIYDMNSPEAIKSSIIAGNGFSFLPKLSMQKELSKDIIKQIKINDLFVPFYYYVAFRKNYEFTKYEEMFIDFITSTKKGFC
ncbi:LysR family transcriptional regulator [Clostridium rectalis]|uniref:LysR family transcriptional regulator n=1 Tax=Clostridium rectalis TaxID=2040295 RepID=UPI000F642B0A|nr:LysR family transcriptional regulator [Clostridium rectalis]